MGEVLETRERTQLRELVRSQLSRGRQRFERLLWEYAEDLPLEDGSADRVVSNGVFDLCPDKRAAFDEVQRVLGATCPRARRP